MKARQMTTVIMFGSIMKKIFAIASLACLATLLSGCSHELLEEPVPEKEAISGKDANAITLTISAVTKNPQVASSTGTKISFGSADATWETGDKIYLIKSDGTTITLTLSDGAGTTSGTFTSIDPVSAGTYIPYAVSATSLSKGYVSVSSGVITLNLANPGGGTLAEALEHDILKGTAITLTKGQTSASVGGLNIHILSFLRFRFSCASKAIPTIGMNSTGGINKVVTIAANGTVTGSDSSTGVFEVTSSDDGAGVYSGYFAIYDKTTVSLLAHATDEDGGMYTRLVSAKDVADYDAGKVYGKTYTLSDAMVTSASEGTLSEQTWENLGLSVKWAKFNYGSTDEYSYDRNVGNCIDRGECNIPSDWANWRFPTRAEVQELFYASQRTWITGSNNGVKFNSNGNYVAMGAGGRYRCNDGSGSWEYGVGSDVYFYIDEGVSSSYSHTVRVWAIIGSSGNSLGFGSTNAEDRNHYYWNDVAMRLVCDY
jgi:hypothetical protein